MLLYDFSFGVLHAQDLTCLLLFGTITRPRMTAFHRRLLLAFGEFPCFHENKIFPWLGRLGQIIVIVLQQIIIKSHSCAHAYV